MTDTDVAFLLYCRSCPCDRHNLYLPSIPASLQTLGRCEYAAACALAPHDFRIISPLAFYLIPSSALQPQRRPRRAAKRDRKRLVACHKQREHFQQHYKRTTFMWGHVCRSCHEPRRKSFVIGASERVRSWRIAQAFWAL